MTSRTFCSGTSFTLPRERSERGRVTRNGLELGERRPTTSAICGGREPAGEALAATLSGVRDFAADRICMAGALSSAGVGRDGGTESASARESAADGGSCEDCRGRIGKPGRTRIGRSTTKCVPMKRWGCEPRRVCGARVSGCTIRSRHAGSTRRTRTCASSRKGICRCGVSAGTAARWLANECS